MPPPGAPEPPVDAVEVCLLTDVEGMQQPCRPTATNRLGRFPGRPDIHATPTVIADEDQMFLTNSTHASKWAERAGVAYGMSWLTSATGLPSLSLRNDCHSSQPAGPSESSL